MVHCQVCETDRDASEFTLTSGGKPNPWCKRCYRDLHLKRYPDRGLPSGSEETCQVCGAGFTLKQRKPAKYCSVYCRNQAKIQVERELRQSLLARRSCQECGGSIRYRQGGGHGQIFCSIRCQRLSRRRRDKESGKRSAYRFWARYGITIAQRDEMLDTQGGCAICGVADPGPAGWAVDHDHACCPTGHDGKTCGQCVRGVLCGRCNMGIGLLGDSPATLRSAARYLER